MQQRARGRDPQALGPDPLPRPLKPGQTLGEVRLPDVPPVDDAEGERAVRGPGREQRRELARRPHEIHVQAMHRQGERRRQVVLEPREVGSHEELQAPGPPREGPVRAPVGLELFLGPVEREAGLVELHPLGPGLGKRPQHLGVDRQQSVEQRQPVEPGRLRLAKQQEGHGADEHRLRDEAEPARLPELVQGLRGRQPEGLAGPELGDDVVVVRVEPLRHLHRGDVATLPLAPSRHREVGVQVHPVAGPAVALGHGADQGARVEHAVVEGEVVGRDEVDPEVALQRPVAGAELGARAQELGL